MKQIIPDEFIQVGICKKIKKNNYSCENLDLDCDDCPFTNWRSNSCLIRCRTYAERVERVENFLEFILKLRAETKFELETKPIIYNKG